MRISRLFVCAVFAAAFVATVIAQQPDTGYHSVACIKVKPENNTEFRKWAAGELHKYAQSRVDTGALASWFILRASIPVGQSAECDYVIVSTYPGIPPQPMGIEELDAALKKAGIAMSGQQYVDRRNSLTTLISNNMYQNQGYVGTFKPGDYFMVNYMKVSEDKMEEYLNWEKTVWKPFAEALDKDGVRSGWSLNTRVLPGGSEQPFQAVTVDIYPSWESVFKSDPQFLDRWRKVHPDMEVGTTFERMAKLRSMIETQLYVVQDLINSNK